MKTCLTSSPLTYTESFLAMLGVGRWHLREAQREGGGGGCSVAQWCPTIYDPVACSMPGSSVLHYLPEFDEIYIRCVGDAISSSHPLLPPPPPTFDLFASGSFPMSLLFTPGGLKIAASASVLPVNIQSSFPLGLVGLFLLSKGFSRLISSTTIPKHQFFGTQPSS